MATDQLHEQQLGVKMGYDEPSFGATTTRWESRPIPLGVQDFTIEYYGNTYGASIAGWCTLFNAAQPENYAPGCLMAYPNPLGYSGIVSAIFEGTSEGDAMYIGYWKSDQEPFHFVLTRSGRVMKAYINGTLTATKEQTTVKDFPGFRLGLANSSLIVHSRIFNHALSAPEVAALYNAGKPGEWVLPTRVKDRTSVQITSGSSYTWTGEGSEYYSLATTSRPFTDGQTYRIKVTVSDFVSGAPSVLLGSSESGNQVVSVPPENGTHEVSGTFRGGFLGGILFYGGLNGTDRRLTLTIDSIEPVGDIEPSGCIAEYLPQNVQKSAPEDDSATKNLTGTRSYTWTGTDDPTYYAVIPFAPGGKQHAWYKINVTVSDYQSGSPFLFLGEAYGIPSANGTYDITARITSPSYLNYIPVYGGIQGADRRLTLTVNSISPMYDIGDVWLDSARQLPINDEYLPPLRVSAGGYDMTASGAPQVLMKPV